MSRSALIEVLQEADPSLAAELDGHLRALAIGPLHPSACAILFAPTGPLQELALDAGWGDAFLPLADRFDAAAAGAGVTRARTTCAVCGLTACVIDLDADGLRRSGVVGTLGLPLPGGPSERLRRAVAAGDVADLHAINPEIVPCHCPTCGVSYCEAHWRTREEWDDGFHDAVYGTCPQGHERMLQD
jgi:hypothetical protein